MISKDVTLRTGRRRREREGTALRWIYLLLILGAQAPPGSSHMQCQAGPWPALQGRPGSPAVCSALPSAAWWGWGGGGGSQLQPHSGIAGNLRPHTQPPAQDSPSPSWGGLWHQKFFLSSQMVLDTTTGTPPIRAFPRACVSVSIPGP